MCTLPHSMAAGIPPEQVIQENNQSGSLHALYDLVSEMAQSPPPHSTH